MIDVPSERGAAAVEFALLVPVLALLAALTVPLLGSVAAAAELDRTLGAGLRYATQVQRHARADACGEFTRRRSNEQVEAFVADTLAAAASILDVRVLVEGGDLCRALSGSLVTVEVSYIRPLGAAAEFANGLSRLLGGGDVFTASPRTATASAVLE